ncbi:MAG TPA: hypothetical protein VM490_23430 [Armatimonadaceae bacterium]|nr:hypothetical protein [Armatimonadaceae bacterium]
MSQQQQFRESISDEETRAVVAAWMAKSHLTPEASVASRASVADLAEGLGVGEDVVAALLKEVRAERAEEAQREREMMRLRVEAARAQAALAEAEARVAEAQARTAAAAGAGRSGTTSLSPTTLSREERQFRAIVVAAALFMLACLLWIIWEQAEADAQRAYPANRRSHDVRRNPDRYP